MKKNYLLPYLLLLSFMVFNACSKDEPESPEPTLHLNVTDSLVFVDIYNSLDGPNWKSVKWDLKDWRTWGVYVEIDENMEIHITKLSTPTDAKGRLPESIGKLSHLKYILMDGYGIVGNLPKSIGDLTNLEEIYIYSTKLSGELPKELANLKKLRILALIGNKFSGQIPAELATLPIGDIFRLPNNLFSDTVPLELIRNRKVDLNNNNITELSWEAWLNPEYAIPELSGNRLHGEIPEEVLNSTMWKRANLFVDYQQKGYGYSNYTRVPINP